AGRFRPVVWVRVHARPPVRPAPDLPVDDRWAEGVQGSAAGGPEVPEGQRQEVPEPEAAGGPAGRGAVAGVRRRADRLLPAEQPQAAPARRLPEGPDAEGSRRGDQQARERVEEDGGRPGRPEGPGRGPGE